MGFTITNPVALKANVDYLRQFMPVHELKIMLENFAGEEGQFFFDKLNETAQMIREMPSTYEQEDLGLDAVVHLHYFIGDSHWYITEKDRGRPDEVNPVQNQAFGFAILNGDIQCAELGYISIAEILDCEGELDLYWTPKTLREVQSSL